MVAVTSKNMVAVTSKYTPDEKNKVVLTIRTIVQTLLNSGVIKLNNLDDITDYLECESTKQIAQEGITEVNRWKNYILNEKGCEHLNDDDKKDFVDLVSTLLVHEYNSECQKIIISDCDIVIARLTKAVEYYKKGWEQEIIDHNKTRELLKLQPKSTIIELPPMTFDSTIKPKNEKSMTTKTVAKVGSYVHTLKNVDYVKKRVPVPDNLKNEVSHLYVGKSKNNTNITKINPPKST